MTSVGDGFAWPFRDPGWLGKMLLQGLIVLIPIIGWIAMNGWLLMAYDNARAGKNELPPAGFHLGRGIGLFFVQLIYGLALGLPAGVFFGGAAAVAAQGHTAINAGGASSMFLFAVLLSIAAGLLIRFLYPVLIMQTAKGGFSAGMDVAVVWRLATHNVGNTIIAALIVWLASVIGGFGFAICFIGIIFTIPYENAITACAAAWLEKESGAAA